jgi:hypoxanthine phosphoribosyltransferase
MSKLLTNEQIQTRLKEIANEINNRYDEITLVVTLTGGIFTAVDLSKYITIPCKFEFVKVSSYGHSEVSSGIVELKYMSKEKGSYLGNVLIIDDIYDTGNTMDYLIKYIQNNFTYSALDTMVLLEKPARREKELNITYTGFTIDNLFVYGYGLDLDDYERNVTDIMVKD